MSWIAELFTNKLHDEIEKEVYGDSSKHVINLEAANMANIEITQKAKKFDKDISELARLLAMVSESDTEGDSI